MDKKAARLALEKNAQIRESMEGRQSPAAAMRAKCLDCNYTAKEVRWCPCTDCPLWQWRFGVRPETTKRKQPEFLDPDFVKKGPGDNNV